MKKNITNIGKKIIFWIALFSIIFSQWLVMASNTWVWFSANWLWYVNDYEIIWAWNVDAVWNEARIITTIRNAINRVLWILWLIALILCLWWWFQMLTAAWDDGKVKTWTKILKNAAIWLIVIGISWLVVTFVFRIINTVAAS